MNDERIQAEIQAAINELVTSGAESALQGAQESSADLPVHLWPICRHLHGRSADTCMANLPSHIPRSRGSLRTPPTTVSFVQRLFEAGRPAPVICHW
jgi:hypothetical protein